MLKYILTILVSFMSISSAYSSNLAKDYPKCADTINVIHDYITSDVEHWQYLSGETNRGRMFSVDYITTKNDTKHITKVLFDGTGGAEGVCNGSYSVAALKPIPCNLFEAISKRYSNYSRNDVQFSDGVSILIINDSDVEVIMTPVGDHCLVVESENIFFH